MNVPRNQFGAVLLFHESVIFFIKCFKIGHKNDRIVCKKSIQYFYVKSTIENFIDGSFTARHEFFDCQFALSKKKLSKG